MHVSVTGLKTNNLYASMKFWLLTIPAFREAQKAEGILLCENKSRNGVSTYAYCLENKGTHAGIPQIAKTYESYESFSINSYWQIAELRK